MRRRLLLATDRLSADRRAFQTCLVAALLLCTGSLALTGCGQKGPLLLPERATPDASPGAAAEREDDAAAERQDAQREDEADEGETSGTESTRDFPSSPRDGG